MRKLALLIIILMLQLKNTLSFKDFTAIVLKNESFNISQDHFRKVEKSYLFLKQYAEDKVIYGVNTGFGPMAQYKINAADQVQLQYNLIRSHAAGSGETLAPKYAKAILLARLNSLILGKSGIHPSVIKSMQDLIRKDIQPVIFEHGGVGASGDLVQLAHLALMLIGEGEVYYKGKIQSAKIVFAQEKISPIPIKIREGLALVNGTSAMTGIGLLNVFNAKKLLNWSVFCSSVLNELVSAFDDHFSEELNAAKLHSGQQKIAKKMRLHLKDSKRIKNRKAHFLKLNDSQVFEDKVQEYYSLRCVPQILGPVKDTLKNVEDILVRELNSANDNPIIDADNENVFHGGNFHGDYIALEMDKLKLVVTKLSMLAERQLNFLANDNLNKILPAFVNLAKPGLNFGIQGAQFTAVSTTAENQTLSTSMYIHSIPNNNDNQDIVSMGSNAALLTKKVITNTYEVIAVELLALVQAFYYLEEEKGFSAKTLTEMKNLKAFIPRFTKDKPVSSYIKELKEYILQKDPY